MAQAMVTAGDIDAAAGYQPTRAQPSVRQVVRSHPGWPPGECKPARSRAICPLRSRSRCRWGSGGGLLRIGLHSGPARPGNLTTTRGAGSYRPCAAAPRCRRGKRSGALGRCRHRASCDPRYEELDQISAKHPRHPRTPGRRWRHPVGRALPHRQARQGRRGMRTHRGGAALTELTRRDRRRRKHAVHSPRRGEPGPVTVGPCWVDTASRSAPPAPPLPTSNRSLRPGCHRSDTERITRRLGLRPPAKADAECPRAASKWRP